MAGSLNLTIEQGADFWYTFSAKDRRGIPLVPVSAKMQVRRERSSTAAHIATLASYDPSPRDPEPWFRALTIGADRSIVLHLTAEETLSLPTDGVYFYDLRVEFAGGAAKRLVEGRVEVSPGVTLQTDPPPPVVPLEASVEISGGELSWSITPTFNMGRAVVSINPALLDHLVGTSGTPVPVTFDSPGTYSAEVSFQVQDDFGEWVEVRRDLLPITAIEPWEGSVEIVGGELSWTVTPTFNRGRALVTVSPVIFSHEVSVSGTPVPVTFSQPGSYIVEVSFETQDELGAWVERRKDWLLISATEEPAEPSPCDGLVASVQAECSGRLYTVTPTFSNGRAIVNIFPLVFDRIVEVSGETIEGWAYFPGEFSVEMLVQVPDGVGGWIDCQYAYASFTAT